MSVVGALAYLEVASLAGMVRQRLRRLRQPKYLVGAIAGAIYLYWFVFRHVFTAPRTGGYAMQVPPALAGALLPVVAAVVLAILVAAWLVPSDRAALRFSEAETSFLFPAPISRTGLIHASVLRAQLGLFLSVFLLSLLLRRGRAVGIDPLQYAFALWLLIATIRLHFLAASFTRERMLDAGLRPAWRRAGALLLLAALAGLVAAWLRAHPLPARMADLRDVAAYIGTTLDAGAARTVLAPFRWLAAPILAASTAQFLHALPAAIALFALHYAWVVGAQVSFEEASMALAQKRAATRAAMRDGRLRLRSAPRRGRQAPFALAAHGSPTVAFLWKDLIAAGPFWRPRNALIAAALIAALMAWLGRLQLDIPLLRPIGLVCLAIAGWSMFVGPMLVQGRLRQMLDHLDVLRATPLQGWQIALGPLLAPVAMLVAVQGLLVFAAACAFWNDGGTPWLTPALMLCAALATVLVAPLLCALMLCVPFAGMLVFPGWSGSGGAGGIDVMGQRLIFGGVYLVALALALAPAVVVSGALAYVLRLATDWPVAIAVASIAGAAVLAVEVVLIVRWLGARIERFDVSTELR